MGAVYDSKSIIKTVTKTVYVTRDVSETLQVPTEIDIDISSTSAEYQYFNIDSCAGISIVQTNSILTYNCIVGYCIINTNASVVAPVKTNSTYIFYFPPSGTTTFASIGIQVAYLTSSKQLRLKAYVNTSGTVLSKKYFIAF